MEKQTINGKTYKVLNGTYYNEKTPDNLVEILEKLRLSKTRIILDYGNTETGEIWGEVYGITGTISRSIGPIKIPILIYNSRSIGGGAILDYCIIGIKTSRGKKQVYTIKQS